MSSKFSRAPRIQPTPPVCKKPPIPAPPDQPISQLSAWIAWIDQNHLPSPIALNLALPLFPDDPQNPTRWAGHYRDETTDIWLDLMPNMPRGHNTLQLSVTVEPDYGQGLRAVYPATKQDPATPQPITTWQSQPPKLSASVTILI
jgi:hypothetical protein